MKPLILIANDDGYHAKGLNQLIQMLKGTGDIIVCAPESARSGYSRAFIPTYQFQGWNSGLFPFPRHLVIHRFLPLLS